MLYVVRAVSAAVVHQKQFVGLTDALHYVCEAFVQRRDIEFFVVKRNDDGIPHGYFFV